MANYAEYKCNTKLKKSDHAHTYILHLIHTIYTLEDRDKEFFFFPFSPRSASFSARLHRELNECLINITNLRRMLREHAFAHVFVRPATLVH
jgi:hypothetical protein